MTDTPNKSDLQKAVDDALAALRIEQEQSVGEIILAEKRLRPGFTESVADPITL